MTITVEEIYDKMLSTGRVTSQRDFSRKMGCPPSYFATVRNRATIGPLMVLWQYLQDIGAHGLANEVFQLVQAKAVVRAGPHKNKRRKRIQRLEEVA